MFSATFMVKITDYNEAYENLNARVIKIAESNPGYLGRESWTERDRNVVILYWRTLEDLQKFAVHPEHLLAKSRYLEWYSGYKIVIAEILREYGDGNYPQPFISEQAEVHK